MDVRGYLRVFRRQWLVILMCVLIGIGAAAFGSYRTTPQYASTVRLFVATPGTDSTNAANAQAYQGGLFSQQRVTSYADLIKGSSVAGRVIDKLKLDMSPTTLVDQISAVATPESVILEVTVTDPNPLLAQRLAQTTAEVFAAYVSELEGASSPASSPIKANIVDAASLPSSPVSPKPFSNIALSAILGLLIGFGAAWLRETLDTTIKSPAALEEITGAASLGTVFYDPSAGKQPLVTQLDSHAPRVESFRVLRTNLQYIDVDKDAKIFAITSPMPGDGKSTTAINMAITLAQAGQRTVLLEADLRRPRVAHYLHLEPAVGLTTVLAGKVGVADVLQPWGRDGLEVITSGSIPPNPAELLQSNAMKILLADLRSHYDVVIIDTPPALPVTDAALLAAEADGAILVIRNGKTTRDQAAQAKKRLDSVGAVLVGTIFNFARERGAKGYGYQYGYGYGYGYGPRTGSDLPDVEIARLQSISPGGTGGFSRRLRHDEPDRGSAKPGKHGAGDDAPPLAHPTTNGALTPTKHP